MATTTPSTTLVPTAPAFTDTERLALTGFLTGYCGPDQPGLRTGMVGGADLRRDCQELAGSCCAGLPRASAGAM